MQLLLVFLCKVRDDFKLNHLLTGVQPCFSFSFFLFFFCVCLFSVGAVFCFPDNGKWVNYTKPVVEFWSLPSTDFGSGMKDIESLSYQWPMFSVALILISWACRAERAVYNPMVSLDSCCRNLLSIAWKAITMRKGTNRLILKVNPSVR